MRLHLVVVGSFARTRDGGTLLERMLNATENHDEEDLPGHLPRLAESAYQGKAIVHWTFTIRDRGTGWLGARFTMRFRWLMLHGCGHYDVACPVHCLMPDHVHLLLHGWSREGDQRGLIRFLRRRTNDLLNESGYQWQPQAHDHVLRPQESSRAAYETLVHYIAYNPVRAGLVKQAQDWPHTGAIIPGYPELRLWQPDFWERYWRLRRSRERRPVGLFARTRVDSSQRQGDALKPAFWRMRLHLVGAGSFRQNLASRVGSTRHKTRQEAGTRGSQASCRGFSLRTRLRNERSIKQPPSHGSCGRAWQTSA